MRELPSFSTSPQLFYSGRMDAVAGKDAITSTQEGNWRTSLTGWWVFEGRRRQKVREHTPEARRIRASKLPHERGGITKAASALISPPAAPRDSRTLAKQRSKHPTEDPAAIESGKAQAEQRTGITAVGEQEQQPNVKSELLDGQDQIPEMMNLFEEATGKLLSRKPTSKALQVRLAYSTAFCRLRCARNWPSISRRLRRLSFPVVFCHRYSGHCKRALTFPP